MKTHCRNALVAIALAAASTSAHAIQADIKVWADVDPTLEQQVFDIPQRQRNAKPGISRVSRDGGAVSLIATRLRLAELSLTRLRFRP